MIILVQDRKDNLHLSDFTTGTKLWTLCGWIYAKRDIINTLALDMPANNVCRTCREEYEKLYGKLLDEMPRYAKSDSQYHLYSKVVSILDKHRHPREKFWYLESRYSEAINRFQRKLTRK